MTRATYNNQINQIVEDYCSRKIKDLWIYSGFGEKSTREYFTDIWGNEGLEFPISLYRDMLVFGIIVET